ncbi:MAG: endonuclease III [Candidatus Obscuribacter sp.]|nr:endonuclease III [Candidatus Obscuribacter sp.]MBK9281574.1 endonuclease III [Candidatus Obscuribacter sp.]
MGQVKKTTKANTKTTTKASAKAVAKESARATTTASTKTTTKASTKAITKSTGKVTGKTTGKATGKTTGKATGGQKSATRGVSKKGSHKATRQEAAAIMKGLLELYPDACCELTYDSDFQLLTAVILSAQCTDQQVNKVTKALYAEFPDARSLAEADLERVKTLIKPTGYYNAKAKNIQACAQMLVTRFNGKVPTTVEELTTLPGVGRKTANVVLGVIHNIPGWSVDTHVQRLSKRFSFTNEEDPLKIEKDLQALFPGEDWSKLSITIIWHGRRLCYARKPACHNCPINTICPASEV